MKYFIYARKSTESEDRQVLSIEAQLEECRQFAIKEGLEVIEEYSEAQTVKEPGRTIFNSMLNKIENGKIDGIIAWNPDRLARNSLDGGKIIYLIDKVIIKDLKFPVYRFDNTAQGKFMLNIIFGQSKYYSDNLSENIKRGLRYKLRNGIWPNWAPLGYHNDNKNHCVVIDNEKFHFVKKIFELYATGHYTLSKIRDIAHNAGLRGRKDKYLRPGHIQRILKNSFYYGIFKFNGETYQGTHEPIISKNLFDKVQNVMKIRSRKIKSKKRY